MKTNLAEKLPDPHPEEDFLDDVLAEASKTPTKEKTKVKTLDVDKKLQELATQIRNMKKEYDSLESQINLDKETLLKGIEKARQEVLSTEYVSTFRIPTTDGNSISFSWKDQYSRVSIELEKEIKNLLGDVFKQFFQRQMEVKVKDSAQNDTMLKQLIMGLGALKLLSDAQKSQALEFGKTMFAEFFAVERWLKPTNYYTTMFFTSALTDKQRTQLSKLVTQFKPSLKK